MELGPTRSFDVVTKGSKEAQALVDDLLMPAANHFSNELDFAQSDIEHVDVEKTFTYDDQSRTYFSFDAYRNDPTLETTEGCRVFFVVIVVQTRPWEEGMYWPDEQEAEYRKDLIDKIKAVVSVGFDDLDDQEGREIQERTEFLIDEENLTLAKQVSCEFHNRDNGFSYDPESQPSKSPDNEWTPLTIEESDETYYSEEDISEIKQILEALGFQALAA